MTWMKEVYGLIFIGLCWAHSDAFIQQNKLWIDRMSSTTETTAYLDRKNDDEPPALMTIPIFPLRKKVRLPTEQLTLNLYEERYLKMADHILAQSQETCFFGALYTANKPQIIKGGSGPIVPLIEKGDIGVIFLLESSEEGMIPTFGGLPRLRKRLVGIGALRFRVHDIVSRGLSDIESSTDDETPFMIASVEIFTDQAAEGKSHDELIKQLTAARNRIHHGSHVPPKLLQFAETVFSSFSLPVCISDSTDLHAEIESFNLCSTALTDGTKNVDRLRALCTLSTKTRLLSL